MDALISRCESRQQPAGPTARPVGGAGAGADGPGDEPAAVGIVVVDAGSAAVTVVVDTGSATVVEGNPTVVVVAGAVVVVDDAGTVDVVVLVDDVEVVVVVVAAEGVASSSTISASVGRGAGGSGVRSEISWVPHTVWGGCGGCSRCCGGCGAAVEGGTVVGAGAAVVGAAVRGRDEFGRGNVFGVAVLFTRRLPARVATTPNAAVTISSTPMPLTTARR